MPTTYTTKPDGGTEVRLAFTPPPVVRDFIGDGTFCTGYFGPFGCAKTTAAVHKVWAYAREWPGARIAVIRSTWPQLRDTTQKTFFEWLPEGPMGTYHRTDKVFDLKVPGSGKRAEIMFRAMDDPGDVQNVLSLDLACAWIDEPQGGVNLRADGSISAESGIARETFLALMGRIGRQAGYHPMIWLTGNPPSPSHWIAQEFGYEPGVSGHDAPKNLRQDYRLYLGDQDTNRAHLRPGYYEQLERLYGVATPMARRYLRGEWIDFATEKPFHAIWFTRFPSDTESVPPPDAIMLRIGIDPAISKKDTAAHTAIVLAAMVTKGINRGRIYVLHADKGHWSVYQQVDELLKLVVRAGCRHVVIENVAYQAGLGEVLEHEARIRGLVVTVDLVAPDADKVRRANAWSALVEQAEVLFGPDTDKLLSAMTKVPQDPKEWDLVDAAGLVIRSFPRLRPESQAIARTTPGETRAASYAVKIERETTVAHGIRPPWRGMPGTPASVNRAKGYRVVTNGSRPNLGGG